MNKRAFRAKYEQFARHENTAILRVLLALNIAFILERITGLSAMSMFISSLMVLFSGVGISAGRAYFKTRMYMQFFVALMCIAIFFCLRNVFPDNYALFVVTNTAILAGGIACMYIPRLKPQRMGIIITVFVVITSMFSDRLFFLNRIAVVFVGAVVGYVIRVCFLPVDYQIQAKDEFVALSLHVRQYAEAVLKKSDRVGFAEADLGGISARLSALNTLLSTVECNAKSTSTVKSESQTQELQLLKEAVHISVHITEILILMRKEKQLVLSAETKYIAHLRSSLNSILVTYVGLCRQITGESLIPENVLLDTLPPVSERVLLCISSRLYECEACINKAVELLSEQASG